MKLRLWLARILVGKQYDIHRRPVFLYRVPNISNSFTTNTVIDEVSVSVGRADCS